MLAEQLSRVATQESRRLAVEFLGMFKLLLSLPNVLHRDYLLWAQSLIHLVLIFRIGQPSHISISWQQKLRAVGCTPSKYLFSLFRDCFAVYVKLPFPCSSRVAQSITNDMAYVGSTTLRMSQREANRVA